MGDSLDDIEFENQIQHLHGDDLGMFNARQGYKVLKLTEGHEKRIASLESHDRKVFGFIGGGAGLIGAAIAAAVDYFVRKQ